MIVFSLRLPLILFLLIGGVWISPDHVMAAETIPYAEIDRVLSGGRVTTTACNQIRTTLYRARLDLFYFYQIEYPNETGNAEPNLVGIETAIASEIAEVLDLCDEADRPMYAVQLSEGHQLTSGT